MHRSSLPRPRLTLTTETLRVLTAAELQRVAAGYHATSEAIDGYPCPGEYSFACTP